MDTAPLTTLNNGSRFPRLGLGTWPMDDEEAATAVRDALNLGYRLVDTASAYGNEAGVGRAIATCDVPREEIVLTTKLRGRDQGYEETLRGFEESRARLGVEYVDLYLIHWPLPRVNRYLESWRAMVRLLEDGLVRTLGVSNFNAGHLDLLAEQSGVMPAVNQVEMHPYFVQGELRAEHQARGVLTESWSPLGRPPSLLGEPAVTEAARAHGVTPAQVVLRWHVQLGAVPIPKSGNPGRQRSNLDVFGFELEDGEMAAISGLKQRRTGGDPETHEEF